MKHWLVTPLREPLIGRGRDDGTGRLSREPGVVGGVLGGGEGNEHEGWGHRVDVFRLCLEVFLHGLIEVLILYI